MTDSDDRSVTGSDDRLIDIALTIADATPVDWSAARDVTPDEADTLDRLRALEGLVAAFAAGPAVDESGGFGLVGSAGASGGLSGVSGALDAGDVRVTWGHLQVIGRLGEGGFGEVFRAFDPTLRREVALKLRRPGPPERRGHDLRWLDEARRLARVRHPNVLTIHGADFHDGRAGIWTELIEGQTLEERLAEQGPLGAREAALVGIDLCAALSAVHAAGLVHGDLKTRNVMRAGSAAASADDPGRLVLMDFDAATERAAPGGVTSGTPLVLAPEVVRGGPATPASDLYSLGVLLYRLLTGRYPIEAANLAELSERLARGERTPLRSARPDLPAPLVAVVERALDVDPARRYADAASMERALADGLAVRGRSGTRTSLAVAGLLVAAAAAVFLMRPDRPVAGAFQAEATLFRRAGTAGQALMGGDRLAPGDRLYAEISGPEPMHVYVFNEDAEHRVHVLFPLVDSETQNPLPAGRRHRLPGPHDGADLDWLVTSAEGSETFLVLAARNPVPAVDSVLATAAVAAPGATVSYATLRPEDLASMRGVAELVRSADVPATTGVLTDLGRRLERSPVRQDLWFRILVLENPAR
jgi:hypothetical protein